MHHKKSISSIKRFYFSNQRWDRMNKHDKIYVKIQIEKDKDSGELTIRTHFDPDAPNLFQEKSSISWYPTHEEIEFINETFELISKHKSKDNHSVNKVKKEKTMPPLEQEKVEDAEVTETKDDSSKTVDKDKELPISADGKTIDEIVKRKKDGTDEIMVEADEETIIDRVLKQKKKGKW